MADSTTTLTASGVAANPTAGTAVATLTAPAAGAYAVRVWVSLGGTLVATTDANNFQVKAGATVIGLIGAPGVAGNYGPFPYDVVMDGASNVTVNAVANASGASAEYGATIEAMPTGTGRWTG